MELLLFPNQLFDIQLLKKEFKKYSITKIHFIEDELYYGNRNGSNAVSKLKLNKLRILFMYVIHQIYVENLRNSGVEVIVMYHKIEEGKFNYQNISSSDIIIFDPCDTVLISKIKKYNKNIKILSSPSFVLSNEKLNEYIQNKKGKQLQHNHFYNYVKEHLGVLKNIKNLDIMNREPYKKDLEEPKNPFRHTFTSVKIWEDGVKWLEKSVFKNNPGPTISFDELINSYLIYLPITTKDVRLWLKDFLVERINNYGKYQDIVYLENPLLFHSGLSIYLNNGIITPFEIITKTLKIKTSMNNIEGFIRQIIGWREYCRLYYLYVSKDIFRKNIFKNNIKSLGNEWYKGNIGIELIDKTIKHAMNYGYINHIQRLMVMSNFMTINEYHPDMIYKWMYEFSLDSYEWVMIFNCYSMGSWSDKGFAMRKPYVSSSNYLLRMSNVNKNSWNIEWDNTFKKFIQKNKDIISHTSLANLIK